MITRQMNTVKNGKGIIDVGNFFIAKVFGESSKRRRIQYIVDVTENFSDGYAVEFLNNHALSYRFIELNEEPVC